MQIELTNRRVLAVDGGTATGKGRLMEELSQAMRLKGVPVIHLSSGSLYRAVSYAALEFARPHIKAPSTKSPETITHEALDLVRHMRPAQLLELTRQRHVEMHGGVVWMDGAPVDVEGVLKGPGVGTGSSVVSTHVPVREYVNILTRRQVNEFDGFVLIDGRDITHTVVPDAPVKLLLVVSPEVAAKRSLEHTIDEIKSRDARDQGKSYGALRQANDPGTGVLVVSTDNHTPEALRDEVYSLMQQAFPELPNL